LVFGICILCFSILKTQQIPNTPAKNSRRKDLSHARLATKPSFHYITLCGEPSVKIFSLSCVLAGHMINGLFSLPMNGFDKRKDNEKTIDHIPKTPLKTKDY
jgi:hypothetical protein